MLNKYNYTQENLAKIGCFFKLENDPPRRDSGFFANNMVIKELILSSFICFGNFKGFLIISW